MFLPKNIRYFVVGKVRYLPALSLNDRAGSVSILFRWAHSVWRLLWIDLIIFVTLYAAVTILYSKVLIYNITYKNNFNAFVTYANKIGSVVPLSFLLGFFVSTVLTRWWQIIYTVPWMSTYSFIIQTYLPNSSKPLTDTMTVAEQNKQLRNLRLTLVRYLNLAWIFQIISLSRQVKKRFTPTEHREKFCLCCNTDCFSNVSVNQQNNNDNKSHGCSVRHRLETINRDPVVLKFFTPLITIDEIRVFERMETQYQKSSKGSYKPEAWVPLQWAVRLLNNAREMNLFRDDRHYTELANMTELLRNSLALLGRYNAFNIPVGYTQVVVLAVHSFFLSEIFAQQYLHLSTFNKNDDHDKINTYIPIFSILKFLFYMGWYKMGLHLISPLSGEKTSAFPMSDILDYNLQISSQMAPADDVFYPNYLTSTAGDANDQLQLLNQMCEMKYDPNQPITCPLIDYDYDNVNENENSPTRPECIPLV